MSRSRDGLILRCDSVGCEEVVRLNGNNEAEARKESAAAQHIFSVLRNGDHVSIPDGDEAVARGWLYMGEADGHWRHYCPGCTRTTMQALAVFTPHRGLPMFDPTAHHPGTTNIPWYLVGGSGGDA